MIAESTGEILELDFAKYPQKLIKCDNLVSAEYKYRETYGKQAEIYSSCMAHQKPKFQNIAISPIWLSKSTILKFLKLSI